MSFFEPTEQQDHALSMFMAGESMAVEARAGTGKTSTLQLMANATDRPGLYVAFNKQIVEDAGSKMPRNITSSTAHSLAYRAVAAGWGRQLRNRLESKRMPSWKLAQALDVDPVQVRYGLRWKQVGAPALASTVMRAISVWCNSADPEPGPQHIPYLPGIDMPNGDGTPRFENQAVVAEHVAQALKAAAEDMRDPNGTLPFTHDSYLKLWQLSAPTLPGGFVLFDEAQDASPVMIDVLSRHAGQVVWVGDSCQAIYEWRGAVNALANVPVDRRAYLTMSFRFGPALARLANKVLAVIGPEALLEGNPERETSVRVIDTAGATFLTRTNAKGIMLVMAEQAAGRTAHLVGGGADVVAFAKAALDLQSGRPTFHRDLSCFSTWGEAVEYVANDPQGDELALLVSLVEKFGADAILAALDDMVPEAAADTIVSTAHKSKGREWDRVVLCDDFPILEGDDPRLAEDLRLAYVAATRARFDLDPFRCPVFLPGLLDGLR